MTRSYPIPAERWYHSYIPVVLITTIMGLAVSAWSDGTTTGLILSFGIMGFLSFAVTVAAWAVDGFTAKSAGAFWTMMTCGAVCASVPVGADLF
jgi:hypothetical protein